MYNNYEDMGTVAETLLALMAKRFAVNEVDDRATYEIQNPSIECECDENDNGLPFSDMLEDIDQVIFNDPATIVTFKDGTKVCVKASKNDTFSKETGLVYAIIKRLYANDVDENGYLRSKGLGEKIAKVVENAIDQKKVAAERRAKMRAKAKAKEAKRDEAKKLEAMANEVSEQAAKEAVDGIYDKKN